MLAMQAIHAERKRQIEVEGWTPEHDDEHDSGEMLRAAVLYFHHSKDPTSLTMRNARRLGRPSREYPLGWPWDPYWWKPKDPRRNLERAGALCLAERERLRRKSPDAFVGHVEQKLGLIVEALEPLLNNHEVKR